MANWKTGWCIGSAIENISSEDQSSEIWYPDSANEAKNHLGDVFRFFGNEDSDIACLSLLLEKKQNDVCRILEKTQPAISYDLGRIKKQKDFVLYLLSVVDDFLYFIEKGEHGLTTAQVDILVLMFFGSKPTPEVAFACGSASISKVLYSNIAKPALRLMAVVVFPTPPF